MALSSFLYTYTQNNLFNQILFIDATLIPATVQHNQNPEGTCGVEAEEPRSGSARTAEHNEVPQNEQQNKATARRHVPEMKSFKKKIGEHSTNSIF